MSTAVHDWQAPCIMCPPPLALHTAPAPPLAALPDPAAPLPCLPSPQVVKADFEDKDSLLAAFQGCDAVFAVTGDPPLPALRAAHVKRKCTVLSDVCNA
jgi:hypothetical protein